MPTRAIVISSRLKVKAGGPEMGKLSIPTDKVGSGSCPAEMADEREASTPAVLACTDGALPAARSNAALNVIGSAKACEGIAEISKAVEIRYRIVLPRFNMGMPDGCQPVGKARSAPPTGMVSSEHQP